jgi:hypothetical protein
MSGAVNASVQNPLNDITNVGSHSGSRSKSSVVIDKENIVIPNSVSPSPFRHRSRFVASKVVLYLFFFLLFLFFSFFMLIFIFQVSKDPEKASLNTRDEVSFGF